MRAAFAGVLTLPLLAFTAMLMVLAGAGANASATSAACGGGGTAATVAGVVLDAEQIGNAATIITVAAGRQLSSYAAVIAVTTAYTESRLHNTNTETDHDSEGLFQQRISIYTKPVADDPVRATNAFLDRLIKIPDWQANPVGIDAQRVQISQYPQRYQPNAALAAQLLGRFWPAAVATGQAAPPASPVDRGTSPATSQAAPAICAGGGGAIAGGGAAGKIVGPTSNTVAGTTHIPAGLVISGSAEAAVAVRYALAQLGKPYLFGAAGPDAFDCSGLTMAAWAAAGITLAHLAAAQASAGTPEPTNLAQAVAGDLVFIAGSDGTAADPGHVGIVVGYVDRTDGRHLFLEQAPMSGLPTELSEASEWSGQIVAVRHIA